MAGDIRFHLDEHVPSAVADGLIRRGIDVTTTVGVGLQAIPDHELLAFTVRAGRVLVTNDAGILSLHKGGVRHAGLAYYADQRRSIGDMIRALLVLHDHLSAEDMEQHVEFL